MQGTVYINGIPIDEVREWYIANTGYALQLATPYCEELTVRENLILAAQMKLPSSMTLREKFKRVEQLIQVVRIDLSDSGIYLDGREPGGSPLKVSNHYNNTYYFIINFLIVNVVSEATRSSMLSMLTLAMI